MALGSLSGPARVDGAWLWGVHLHVQVGAQRNRREEPHPAQRRAGLCLCGPACQYPLELSPAIAGQSLPSKVSRPARLARALDVERVAWGRVARSPLPGLRGRPFLRSC